jgi:hypothetical protein
MWVLIPILGIVAVFGVPAYLFKRYFDLKERQLKQQNADDAETRKELAGLKARIQVLESIVVDSDYDLNRKLDALDENKAEARALPKVPGNKP